MEHSQRQLGQKGTKKAFLWEAGAKSEHAQNQGRLRPARTLMGLKCFCFLSVRPEVSLHPGPSYATEGRNFILPTCHVTGYPAPVVTWRKSSGQLPQGRVRYNNSALQILHVRKDDLDTYFCSAANLLGSVEKKTLLVVVTLPRFTMKPPARVNAYSGDTLRLNCSATGDPQPVINWKKQGGQLPVGRSQQINGALVIRDLAVKDEGNYICVATSAGVFDVETGAYIELLKGRLIFHTLFKTDIKSFIANMNKTLFRAFCARSSQ